MCRLLLALILMVTVGTAEAARVRTQLGGSKRIPSSGTSDVFRLYIPDGPTTSLRSTTGTALTFTRASAATCWRPGYTMTTLANNEACALGGKLQREGAATNLALYSEELDNAAWTPTNVTVTANNGGDPYGTTLGDTLTTTSAGGFLETTTGLVWSGTTGSASVHVKTASGTQSVILVARDVTAGVDRCSSGGITATTSYQRIFCRSTGFVNGNTIKLRIYPGAGGTGSAIFSGAQAETTLAPSSYIKTTGTSATRALGLLTVSTSGFPLSSGSFVADFEPAWDLAPPDNGLAYLFMSWAGAGNGLSFYLQATAIGVDHRGSAGAFGVTATVAAIAANVSAKYRFEWEPNKNWRIYKNGTLANSGTHTLTYSSQTTGYVGSNNGSIRYLWGWLGPTYCFSNSVNGCR